MPDRCFDKCVFVGKPYGVSQESYCQHCARTGESNSDFYHEDEVMMSKEIDIICETMHKSGVPLSEDQRVVLAGCLTVLCDKQKIRTDTLDEVKEIIEDLDGGAGLIEVIDNLRGRDA